MDMVQGSEHVSSKQHCRDNTSRRPGEEPTQNNARWHKSTKLSKASASIESPFIDCVQASFNPSARARKTSSSRDAFFLCSRTEFFRYPVASIARMLEFFTAQQPPRSCNTEFATESDAFIEFTVHKIQLLVSLSNCKSISSPLETTFHKVAIAAMRASMRCHNPIPAQCMTKMGSLIVDRRDNNSSSSMVFPGLISCSQ
jgi:hypothetical protein